MQIRHGQGCAGKAPVEIAPGMVCAGERERDQRCLQCTNQAI